MHAGYEEEDAYLGIPDLYLKFDGEDGWGLGLMEMLVDPMLVCWVPGWVREQYERANPYFRSVLKRLETCKVLHNKVLLRRTKREMVKQHEAKVLRAKINGKDADAKKDPGDLSEDSLHNSDVAACESDDPEVAALDCLRLRLRIQKTRS